MKSRATLEVGSFPTRRGCTGPRWPGSPSALRCVLAAAALARSLLLSPPATASWEPVPASDLALATPRVEPGASAEVLLWRVFIDDRYEGGDFNAHQDQFVRLKLFDDRAVQKYATVSFRYPDGTALDEIEARTVLPAGTTLEVPHTAFREHTIVSRGRRKLRELAFAAPGLLPGPSSSTGCISTPTTASLSTFPSRCRGTSRWSAWSSASIRSRFRNSS